MATTTFRRWLIGGMVAVASGLSDVFILGLVDPQTFNLENARSGLIVFALFGIKAGLFYVREHGRELIDE